MLAVKKFLIVAMLIGAAAYFGGGSTFASFNAETTNGGSSAASGTLTLDNQVESASACLSANAPSANNVHAGCDALFNLTNLAPGVYGGVAKVTVQNSGSIDASKLYFWAAPVMAKLNAPIALNASVASLTITPLQGTIASGDHIVVSYGSNAQTFIASAGVAGGSTTVPVTTATANFAYPVGATATDTDGNTAATTNCYDTKTTTPGTAGATAGQQLNFNPTAGNPFCSTALIFVQETTGGKHYCWLGKASTTAGYCVAPISVTLQTALPAATSASTLVVNALNGNVTNGDQIAVKSGNTTVTFTANANASFGATSISVAPLTPSTTLPIGSTVTDTTSLGSLNSDTTDTITNFNTMHNGALGKIQLYPVSSSGVLDTAASVQLSHFNSGTYARTFQVGVYLPAPTGQNQNPLQGLISTFGITWHIDQ
jgi:hypothetical protein